ALQAALGENVTVEIVATSGQIGSGSLPVESLDSFALAMTPNIGRRGTGRALKRLATAFRSLQVPVLGHIANDALHFDLRCLEDEAAFADQLVHLRPA
ncbi:MAG: hypothetical protein QF830_12675, partial [Rhodospirillales bacterium]|nr:hypothetical protein [Rhodospirillales bacterium]